LKWTTRLERIEWTSPFSTALHREKGSLTSRYQDSLGREARVSIWGVGGHVEDELLGWIRAPALLHRTAVVVIPKVPV